MGHWADKLLPEVKARLKIRGAAKDEVLLKNLRRAQAEIELLAGRRFGVVETAERHIEPGGLPFVDVPDLRVGSQEVTVSAWPVPDPVHPDIASVLQLGVPGRLFDHAAPPSEALWVAGHLLAGWSANDGLTGATLLWLQERSQRGEFEGLVRRLMEPHRLSFIPVGAAEFKGWWIQLSRRLVVITRESPDEAHLVEPLAPLGDWGVLAAAEPRLIVARLTEHPVTWAMVARVWKTPDGPVARPWRHLADAIHRHGLPVLAIDDSTTPDEAGAHLLLVAGWHGYLANDDAVVPDALARAYPREVARVRRGTDAPSDQFAATLLWERLLRPGFDPMRSAESVRRYVRRQSSTIVRAHRSAQVADPPWLLLGVSQRYYYKLLARFATKSLDGRYDVDPAVGDRIRRYLDERDARRGRHNGALELLRLRGFTEAAARKWLQRHPIDSVRSAWPRAHRSRSAQTPSAEATSGHVRSVSPSKRRR